MKYNEKVLLDQKQCELLKNKIYVNVASLDNNRFPKETVFCFLCRLACVYRQQGVELNRSRVLVGSRQVIRAITRQESVKANHILSP